MDAVTWFFGLSSISVILIIGLLTFLVILWVILPFAVFGLKKRVDAATIELVKANRSLKSIERQLGGARSSEPDTDQFVIKFD